MQWSENVRISSGVFIRGMRRVPAPGLAKAARNCLGQAFVPAQHKGEHPSACGAAGERSHWQTVATYVIKHGRFSAPLGELCSHLFVFLLRSSLLK